MRPKKDEPPRRKPILEWPKAANHCFPIWAAAPGRSPNPSFRGRDVRPHGFGVGVPSFRVGLWCGVGVVSGYLSIRGKYWPRHQTNQGRNEPPAPVNPGRTHRRTEPNPRGPRSAAVSGRRFNRFSGVNPFGGFIFAGIPRRLRPLLCASSLVGLVSGPLPPGAVFGLVFRRSGVISLGNGVRYDPIKAEWKCSDPDTYREANIRAGKIPDRRRINGMSMFTGGNYTTIHTDALTISDLCPE